MKILFFFLVLVHGLIHLIGFFKAFNIGEFSQDSVEITKVSGALWFIAFTMFVVTGILFILNKEWWLVAGLVAGGISQWLIISSWHDARFGTIANIVVLVMVIDYAM